VLQFLQRVKVHWSRHLYFGFDPQSGQSPKPETQNQTIKLSLIDRSARETSPTQSLASRSTKTFTGT
jgi:hypothetical protein